MDNPPRLLFERSPWPQAPSRADPRKGRGRLRPRFFPVRGSRKRGRSRPRPWPRAFLNRPWARIRSVKQLLTGGKTLTTLSCYSWSKRARKLGIWGFAASGRFGMILAHAYYAAGRPGMGRRSRQRVEFSGDPPLPVARLTPATSHRVIFCLKALSGGRGARGEGRGFGRADLGVLFWSAPARMLHHFGRPV